MKKVSAERGRTIQDAIFDGEKALFRKFDIDKMSEDVENTLAGYAPTLYIVDSMVEQTRLKAVETTSVLIVKARKGGTLETLLRAEISRILAQERSFSVQQGLDRARQLLGH